METRDLYQHEPEADKSYEFGGFWVRWVASLIDYLLLMIVSGIFMFTMDSTDFKQHFLRIIIWFAYFVFMESSSKQATIGKQLMGLKVTNEQFQRLTVEQAIVRFVCKIPSALILMLGYIMAAFDSKKQALHDKLAYTYVIISRP